LITTDTPGGTEMALSYDVELDSKPLYAD
jgi:hypothetical protein